MKKDLLLFAAFIFGVATTAGAAKNKAGERIDTLKARQLQEVQVISTRASKKAPLAFTNVSKNDIQAVNYGKDIPYLLALTPSITLTSDAGNGIGYTTLRVRGTDPSRVNITANGIPMNDAESSSLFWSTSAISLPAHRAYRFSVVWEPLPMAQVPSELLSTC